MYTAPAASVAVLSSRNFLSSGVSIQAAMRMSSSGSASTREPAQIGMKDQAECIIKECIIKATECIIP